MRFVGPDPLQSVVDPVGAQDAATKTYVDALVAARTLTPTAVLTGAYAARPGQFARLNVTTGSVVVTLPSDAGAGQLVGVKKVDASGNTVQVSPASPQKLDGSAAPLVLSSVNQTVLVAFDGTDWAVVATGNIAGPAGPAGASGTVAVGTTTTGPAGSNASVSNTGTASAAVLNFTIPTGPAGPTGSFASSWQGKFYGNVTYPPGSVVFHQGSTYMNSMTVTNGDYVPTEQLALAAPTSAVWKLVAKGYNNAGAYSSSTAYTGGDVVTYQGQVYLSLGYNNAGAGNSPTDASTNWVLWAAKGANGAAATVTVGTTTALAAGATPTVTNAGTSTAAVLNFAIPAGATGTAGAAATVAVGTVTTGAAGTAAAVSNSGSSSAAVLNFTIPRGAPGADGNPGTAATITVGTVTTGAPGSPVTVTNTGSTSAATLNFSIPAGTAGTAGTAGAAATVTVGTTTALAAGATPTVTNSGTSAAAVLNFAIPAGAAGAAATVTVGAVTTGAPGSPATVTNSGTPTAATLDFTIPAGAPGSAGAAATVTVGTTTALAAGATPTVTNTGSSAAAVLNFGIPAGAPGTAGARGVSGAGTPVTVTSTAYTAQPNDYLLCVPPVAGTTITLPTTPTVGTIVSVRYNSTVYNAGTVTVNLPGATNDTNAQTQFVTYGQGTTLIYTGSTYGWVQTGHPTPVRFRYFQSGSGIQYATNDVVVSNGVPYIWTGPTTTAAGNDIPGAGSGSQWAPLAVGAAAAVAVRTSAYNAVGGQLVPVDASGGPVTITLPAQPAQGTQVTVKKVDATGNAVTVVPASTATTTMDGDPSATIVSPGAAATFSFDGVPYPYVWRISSTAVLSATTATPAAAAADTLLTPAYSTGSWYSRRNGTGAPLAPVGAAVCTASTIYYAPLYLYKQVTADQVAAAFLTAGTAGLIVRLGLYTCTAAGAPGALLQDYGTVAPGAATGIFTITGLTATIPKGWSYVALSINSITPGQIAGTDNRYGAPTPVQGLPQANFTLAALVGGPAGVQHYTQAGSSTAAALAATATPVPYYSTASSTSTAPDLYFRIA